MDYPRMMVRGERWIIRTAIVLMTVIVIVQLFFLKGSFRPYLSHIDRMEGESVSIQLPLYTVKPLEINESSETVISPAKSLREGKVLVFRTIKPRASGQIFLTVNGQRVGDFINGDLKITVYNGDYLEIDASSYEDAAQIVVHVPNGGVVFPEDGMVLDVQNATVVIGKIRLKGS